MTTIRIKPTCKNVAVRRPDGQRLSLKGETVKRIGYWLRRINDGDVTMMESKPKAETKTKPKKLAPLGGNDDHTR